MSQRHTFDALRRACQTYSSDSRPPAQAMTSVEGLVAELQGLSKLVVQQRSLCLSENALSKMTGAMAASTAQRIVNLDALNNADAIRLTAALAETGLNGEDKSAVANAIASKVHGLEVNTKSGSAKTQNLTAIDKYLNAADWAIMDDGNKSLTAKATVVVSRWVAVGLKNLSEDTVRFGAALVVTCHFSQLPSAKSIYNIVQDMKDLFKSTPKPDCPGAVLKTYPLDPKQLEAERLKHAYPDDDPPLNREAERLRLIAKNYTPVRSTSKLLKEPRSVGSDVVQASPFQPAASSQQPDPMAMMQHMCMNMMRMMQGGAAAMPADPVANAGVDLRMQSAHKRAKTLRMLGNGEGEDADEPAAVAAPVAAASSSMRALTLPSPEEEPAFGRAVESHNGPAAPPTVRTPPSGAKPVWPMKAESVDADADEDAKDEGGAPEAAILGALSDRGKHRASKSVKDTPQCTKTVLKRPSAASSSESGPTKMPTRGNVVFYGKGKVYFSEAKNSFRVIRRLHHRSDKPVAIANFRDKATAWKEARRVIDDYDSDELE